MRGKLIVLEGTDGSGKTTQAGLMAQRLEREGVPFRQISFPRYGSGFAKPVELYLQGALASKPGSMPWTGTPPSKRTGGGITRRGG